MTQLGEDVTVADILEHGPDCPFCKENEGEKPDDSPVSKDDDDLYEDDPAVLIGNSSGKLDSNMKGAGDPRPTNWEIDLSSIGTSTGKRKKEEHTITPNPHHLIPGNESLKRSTELLKWIFEDKEEIKSDIGYSVNHEKNGVWLPSNNSMRGDGRWKNMAFKTEFAKLAMDEAGGHFHDRHVNPYSEFVKKILDKIADRMSGNDAQTDCPYNTEKNLGEDKYEPPYALVTRLDGVSERLKSYVTDIKTANQQVYTSKLVQSVWNKYGYT